MSSDKECVEDTTPATTSAGKWVFQVKGIKKNGDSRDKTFNKINHALQFLWRIKEAREIILEAINVKTSEKYVLFIKISRRRGINTKTTIVPDHRPNMRNPGNGQIVVQEWKRLPTRWNEIAT